MRRINKLIGKEIILHFENGEKLKGKLIREIDIHGGTCYFLLNQGGNRHQVYSRGKKRIASLGNNNYIQKNRKKICAKISKNIGRSL